MATLPHLSGNFTILSGHTTTSGDWSVTSNLQMAYTKCLQNGVHKVFTNVHNTLQSFCPPYRTYQKAIIQLYFANNANYPIFGGHLNLANFITFAKFKWRQLTIHYVAIFVQYMGQFILPLFTRNEVEEANKAAKVQKECIMRKLNFFNLCLGTWLALCTHSLQHL